MSEAKTFVIAVQEAIRAIYLAASPSVDLDLIPKGESVHYNHCVLTISEASRIWDSVFKSHGLVKEMHNDTKTMWLINSAPSDTLGRKCSKSCYVCSMGFSELVDLGGVK